MALRQPNSLSANPNAGNIALAADLGLGSVVEAAVGVLVVLGEVRDAPVGVVDLDADEALAASASGLRPSLGDVDSLDDGVVAESVGDPSGVPVVVTSCPTCCLCSARSPRSPAGRAAAGRPPAEPSEWSMTAAPRKPG